MKTHWKSSENPLYVKIIWKRGVRHAVLYNESSGLRCHCNKKKSLSSTLKSPSVAMDHNLETCLTKLKLVAPDESTLTRAVSCDPSLHESVDNIFNSERTSKSEHISNSTFLMVAHFIENVPEKYNVKNCQQDTFTERIMHWLNASSATERLGNIVELASESEKTNNKSRVRLKERPKTTSVLSSTKKVQNEMSSDLYGRVECSFSNPRQLTTSCGRPQLHVFVPIFEK